uniref:EF-hand domain-containing protein n=1 Tax=Eutreptiella gymnastica TaxID=73025 RepID=A0A7S1I647_9EUGL|mmetsp:Transcript_133159/g.230884  ORF Transcript_133159/g.230884 Transcript_133159/m.230884 type:complete len:564 (+) Transcript_133159:154-1845(+)
MVLPPVAHGTIGNSFPPHRSNIIVGEMSVGNEATAQHWQSCGGVTLGVGKTTYAPHRATRDQADLRNHETSKLRSKSPTPVARRDHNDFTRLRLQALKRVFDQCDFDQSGDLNPQQTTMVLQELGWDPTPNDVQRVVERADRMGNFTLTFDEFAAGCLDASDHHLFSGIKRKAVQSTTLQETYRAFALRRQEWAPDNETWTSADARRNLETLGPRYERYKELSAHLAVKAEEAERRMTAIVALEAQLAEERRKHAEVQHKVECLQSQLDGLNDPAALLPGVMSHIDVANSIARTLHKDCTFDARISKDLNSGQSAIEVSLKTPVRGYFWSLEKFHGRFAEMLNMYREWLTCRGRGVPYVETRVEEADPFLDTNHQLVGTACAWLKHLGEMKASALTLDVLDSQLRPQGQLSVSLLPSQEQEDLDRTLEGMLGEDLSFRVCIQDTTFNTVNGEVPFTDSYVRYKLHPADSEGQYFRTPKGRREGPSQVYNYAQDHSVFLNRKFYDHLATGQLQFEVWASVRPSLAARFRTKTKILGALRLLAHSPKSPSSPKGPCSVPDRVETP